MQLFLFLEIDLVVDDVHILLLLVMQIALVDLVVDNAGHHQQLLVLQKISSLSFLHTTLRKLSQLHLSHFSHHFLQHAIRIQEGYGLLTQHLSPLYPILFAYNLRNIGFLFLLLTKEHFPFLFLDQWYWFKLFFRREGFFG